MQCQILKEQKIFIVSYIKCHLTIRSDGRMDYESIDYEAVGRMGYSNS